MSKARANGVRMRWMNSRQRRVGAMPALPQKRITNQLAQAIKLAAAKVATIPR